LLLGYDWAAQRTSQTGLAREPNGILAHGHSREEKTFFIVFQIIFQFATNFNSNQI
jgi:hypothetical protein